MTLDDRISSLNLDAKIARLEMRAEQRLLHYRMLDRHTSEARATREKVRIMLMHLLNYERQRAALRQEPDIPASHVITHTSAPAVVQSAGS